MRLIILLITFFRKNFIFLFSINTYYSQMHPGRRMIYKIEITFDSDFTASSSFTFLLSLIVARKKKKWKAMEKI